MPQRIAHCFVIVAINLKAGCNAGCNNKCFLLNPKKVLAQIRLVVSEKKKRKKYSLIPKNDVI